MTKIQSILSDDENKNSNKQLRHYDGEQYIRLSVDETIANNLNEWYGWSCSAGTNGLYIDFDGNIWICNTASSVVDRFNYSLRSEETKRISDEFTIKVINGFAKKEEWQAFYDKHFVKFNRSDNMMKKILKKEDNIPGLLGNIFDGFDLPKKHSICQWKCCGCGADVFLAKAKTENHFEKLPVYHNGYNGQTESMNDLKDSLERENIVSVEPNFPIPYQILWDLGRNCNYDCSYCWPSVHNRDAPHKSLDALISTADKIITEWANNNEIRWNFGGGEPTINPNFLEFLKYLKSKNQWTLITTNGSRPRKYWKEAVQYINSINLSVHFEFIDESKLLNNIEEICNHFDEHDDDHWLEIKLMCTPISIDRAIKLKDMIKQNTSMMKNGANNRIKGAISFVPIRSLADSGVLVDYTTEQLQLLQIQ